MGRAWLRSRAPVAFSAPDIVRLEFPASGLPALRPRFAARQCGGAARGGSTLSQLARTRAATSHRAADDGQRDPAARAAEGPNHTIDVGRASNMLDMDGVVRWLELNGYSRASTVRVAGRLCGARRHRDLFRAGMDAPIRLDFFGDTLDSNPQLRPRKSAQHRAIARAQSGARGGVSAHQRNDCGASVPAMPRPSCAPARRSPVRGCQRWPALQRMEHWLSAIHPKWIRLFDYAPGAPVVLDRLPKTPPRAPDADRRLLRCAPQV